MIVLVSGATEDVAEAPASIGVLVVPRQRARLESLSLRGRVWAVDNGAFTGLDYEGFERLLGEVSSVSGVSGVSPCRFVAAPDVVADCEGTLRKFRVWGRMIRSLGLPVALVAQDGLTVPQVPWDELDALFVGGSTDWKMGQDAETLLAYAAARGKWRHVGRVNSRRRMQHFYGLTDSIDGSGFSKWPKRIRLATRWLRELQAQPTLWRAA